MNMNLKDIVTLSTTTAIAIVEWAVAHWLSSRREIEQKKREFRGEYSHFFVKCAAGIVRGTIPPALRQALHGSADPLWSALF